MGDPEAAIGQSPQVAFQRYVVPEIEVLLRVALSITRNPADAEDLVQDTLLRAYQAIGRFDGAYPRAWLLTILRNTQINRVRKRRPPLLDDPDIELQNATAEDDGPEAIVVGQTFDAVVETALQSLPVKFRQVVELVDIDELSYAEAAQMLNVPVGTVMSRLHRARRRIRDRLVGAGLAPVRGEQ